VNITHTVTHKTVDVRLSERLRGVVGTGALQPTHIRSRPNGPSRQRSPTFIILNVTSARNVERAAHFAHMANIVLGSLVHMPYQTSDILAPQSGLSALHVGV